MVRQLGVRYRRGEAAPTSPVGHVIELRPEALAALPGDLRAELREALLALNAERTAGIIERVTECPWPCEPPKRPAVPDGNLSGV